MSSLNVCMPSIRILTRIGRDIGTFMNITMPVTPKYVKAFLTLPTNAEHLGVADDGAMSHVLGKVWQVQADTGRHVNLIGADDQLTFRKNNLSVVSAIAQAYPATGPPVILLAHESPLNPDADFTLLSEYQLRDNGCLFDFVSKKHKTVQGGYGTQSFYPSGDTDRPLLPLVLRQALLTFRLKPVEEGDCERYQIIEISADRSWCPEIHNDDDGVYVRPVVSNETLTYQPMATNFVSAGTCSNNGSPWEFRRDTQDPRLQKFDPEEGGRARTSSYYHCETDKTPCLDHPNQQRISQRRRNM
jgi:hypothetical protein